MQTTYCSFQKICTLQKFRNVSGEGSIYYRMLSEYGSGSFQLIRFENDLLMILIADYTPKGNL